MRESIDEIAGCEVYSRDGQSVDLLGELKSQGCRKVGGCQGSEEVQILTQGVAV